VILELLTAIVILQVGLAVLLLALTFGHSRLVRLRTRRHGPQVQEATEALARLLAADGPVDEAVVATTALPVSVQIEVLSVLARSLRGEQRTQLTRVAEGSGLAAQARDWTRSRRGRIRLRGVRTLLRVGATPEDVHALLADPWPPVRVDAARLVIARPEVASVEGLVGLLADASPAVAFAAKDSLVRCGVAAEPAVAAHLARSDTDAAVRAALLEVAVHVAGPRHLGLTEQHRDDPDPRVRLDVARLAAAVGTREGVAVLMSLLDDEDEQVRAGAAEGLGHVGHWPATPRITALLADPAWGVRHAAGRALRRMGAPGALYLRRALADPDDFARDMARQVLDLPDRRSVRS
jgi:hypothetical protein